MASWARRFGRKPYEHGLKSASKIGSSTNFNEACTTRSAVVGMPSERTLPLALGIVFSRTRWGTKRPALRSSRSPPSSPAAPNTTERGATPSTPAVRAPLLPPHPSPCHDEERRVIDEGGEGIETTARIGCRPLVQLRLHHEYPLLGLVEAGPRSADVHRRPPRSALMLRTRWTPSPCDRLSRPRTTTGPPSHPGGISRRRAFRPTSWPLAGKGTAGMVPTFTLEPFDGVGAQLCPCSIATATPQPFAVASRPATSPSQGVPHTTTSCGCALLCGPDPPGSSRWVS